MSDAAIAILSNVITVIVAIFGSTGFWSLIQSKKDSKRAEKEAILGILYTSLKNSCESYIDQGHISADELEDLTKYAFEPYDKLGGNGTVKALMMQVRNLPIKK